MYVEETRSGVSYVEHVIRGKLEDVLEGVAKVFGDHHPLGYGTVVKRLGHTEHKDGPYEAVVWRAKSCD